MRNCLVLSAATICLLIAWSSHAGAPSSDLPLQTERSVSFATNEGTFMSVDISPDGRTIVFDLLGDLYRMPVTGGRAEPLTEGPAYDQHPRFSPDGRQIAFVSDRNGASNLWLIGSDGSNERQLSRFSPFERPALLLMTPVWERDGSAVIASTFTIYTLSMTLRRFALDGREAETLALDYRLTPRPVSPAISADGRQIYYSEALRCQRNLAGSVYSAILPCSQIYVWDRFSRQGYVRTKDVGGAVSPLLSPDGRWLAYATRDLGRSGWRLRDQRSGEERSLLVPIERDIQDGMNINGSLPGAAFYPDSSAILVSMDGGIWRIDVPSGKKHPIQFEVQVRRSLGPLTRYQRPLPEDPIKLSHVAHPQFSPDGSTIAFTALDKVWTMGVRDGVVRRLTRSADAIERHPHWSPDGRYIVYSSWEGARGGHVYRQRFGSNSVPAKLTEQPARYLLPAYTSDGTSIVVTRDGASESGAVDIFDLLVLPAEGGGAAKFLTAIAASRQSFVPTFGETLALHFVRAAPGKVFLNVAEHGFVAVDLQSGKRCTIAKFGGAVEGLDYEPGAYAGFELVPKGDGRTALLRLGRHVYRISLDGIDLNACGEPKVVELGYPQSPVRAERLSRDGGLYSGWTAAGGAFYALGPTIYQHDLADGHEIPRRSSVFDLSDDRPTQHVVNIAIERDAPQGMLLLRHVRIVTMRGDEIIDDGVILLAGNRIVAIGPASQVVAPPDAAIRDLHGMTITPGFIDTHCHVREARFESSPGKEPPWELMNTLAYGVTTCADPYGSPRLAEIRDRIDAGSFVGSRLVISGEGLTWQEVLRSGEEAGIAIQRDVDAYRTRWTKYYVTGHRLQQQWIAKGAHERQQSLNSEGLYFAYDIASILDGLGSLAHSIALPYYHDDVAQLLAASGTALHVQPASLNWNNGGPINAPHFLSGVDASLLDDPKAQRFWTMPRLLDKLRQTVLLPRQESTASAYADELRRLMERGVPVGIGDHGEFLGIGMHWAIWSLSSGMSNHMALRAATQMGAESIGLRAELGTVESGKIADLNIFSSDPLQDIRGTRSIRYVMKNGRLYDAETLAQIWPDERALPPQWWQHRAVIENERAYKVRGRCSANR